MISHDDLGILDRMVYCGAVSELEAANIARQTIGLPALSQTEFDAMTPGKDLEIRRLIAENVNLSKAVSDLQMGRPSRDKEVWMKPDARVKKSWQWW